MKQIKTVNELLTIIARRNPIFNERNGIKYTFDLIRVLDCKLSELMEMISQGILFYNEN